MSIEDRVEFKQRVLLEGQDKVDAMVVAGEPIDTTMSSIRAFVITKYGEQTTDAIGCIDRLYKYINKKYKEL